MVILEPFQVEVWMDEHENTPGVINISETCSASISIDELVALSKDKSASRTPVDSSAVLGYGPIKGSALLKERIAAIYRTNAHSPPLPPDHVLVTQGAISANFLVLYALLAPGDHVICVHPTYAQLYAVPQSLGAHVSLWKLRKENNFVPDVAELDSLVRHNTKMIIINNPNNPTGRAIPTSVIESIVDFARKRDIIVFCDEVYWPLFHSLPEGFEPPASILSFGYEKVISTGSMSKTYALAGLRLGWVASRDSSIISAIAQARDYTTISVSQLDDQVARYALSEPVLPSLLERNLTLARTNLDILDQFVKKHSSTCTWVKPNAGTTAFVQFIKDGKPVDDADFCLKVLQESRVMIVPGGFCFGPSDFRGYVRVGYVCHTAVLRQGLEALENYLMHKF